MGEGQSKEYWQKDEEVAACNQCGTVFSVTVRKHHCRNCGMIFCANCSSHTCPIPLRDMREPVRVCDACFVTLNPHRAASAQMPPSFSSNAAAYSTHTGSIDPYAGTAAAAGAFSPNGIAGAGAAAAMGPRQDRSPDATVASHGEGFRPADNSNEEHLDERNASGAEHPPGEEGEQAYGDGIAAPDDAHRNLYQQQYAYTGVGAVPPGGAAEAADDGNYAALREPLFIDIGTQRPERVEVGSTAEYWRNFERLRLEVCVPDSVLGSTVLPLPRPAAGSTRALVEPVDYQDTEQRQRVVASCVEFMRRFERATVPEEEVQRSTEEMYECK